MIRAVLVLVVIVLGWLAALWFLIAPDFSQWAIPQLAALHLAPPVITWGGWMLWRRHRNKNAERIAAEREAVEERERQAKREAARAQHDNEIAHRTFACDCRALALVQLSAKDDEDLVPPAEGVLYTSVDPQEPDDVDESQTLLDFLRPGLEEALTSVYSSCPAALSFPVYVAPPADAVGDEVFTCVREIRARVAEDVGSPARPQAEMGRILFLPSGTSIADCVIGLFESDPELPGAVVLAFDAPAWNEWRRIEDGGEIDDPVLRQSRQWLGQPGQGVVAMFLTPTRLAEMLQAAPRFRGEYDAMTPYWEKTPAAASGTLLAGLSEDERENLQQAPVLARIHRAAAVQFEGKPMRSMELTRTIETLIERAQINAQLVDLPFESTGETAGSSDNASTPPGCAWLIHNAGGVDCSGTRLAALGVGLLNRGIDVDPISEASNLVVRIGDLGAARGVAMLALTVARAAGAHGPALCAEFAGNDSLGLSFAVLPPEAA